nr:PREDICTED: C2 domain-containing protein 3 [Latimeria chalumnae]|eukprot:XP_014348539.1 PREDICTED: C2 domain-containing protein 3 [Latimeria chalumnae]
MKNKKSKSSMKGGGHKKKAVSDVSPSTSLPPLVEGHLRCFLRVTVSKILWTIPKPLASPLIRLRWWGETSDGTYFRPRDTSQTEQKVMKTTARYAIRCGPKQFTSYLTGMLRVFFLFSLMDSLIKEQKTTLTVQTPFIRKQVFLFVFLQVSLALEPLSETYDSNSSVPTTDISLDTAVSALGLRTKTGSSENLLIVPAPSRRLSCTSASGKDSVSSSVANTPRGKDHLYFQENAKVAKESKPISRQFSGSGEILHEDVVETTRGPDHPKKPTLLSKPPPPPSQAGTALENQAETRVLEVNSQATKDIISVLLDRGSKLRNAMVVSAMKSDVDTGPALKEMPLSVPSEKEHIPLPGKLLQNLLDSDAVSPSKQSQLPLPESSAGIDTEGRAIALLLGSIDSSPLRYWDGTGSPPQSPSGGSSAYDESELNDPHYDQSLLENLFYSNIPKSDVSLSDFTSEDDENKSVRKALRARSLPRESPGKTHGRIRRASESGVLDLKKNETSRKPCELRGSPLHPLDNAREQTGQADDVSLSLDRLALLGRIHLARVIVETLKIPLDSSQTTPSKKISKGKPPRPASARKCTYFVEFYFPVASSREGGGQVSITTETTRIASSKVIGGVVKFQQRFVFPVRFSGSMIDRWWNSSLEFKIYSRKSTQKKPVFHGTANLPLRDVIQSEYLSLAGELPVEVLEEEKERPLGPLKICVELAADNKDFTTTKSRAAVSTKTPSYAVTSSGPKLPELNAEFIDVPRQSSHHLQVTSCRSPARARAAENEQLQVVHEMPRVSMMKPPQPSRSLLQQFSAAVVEEEGTLMHVLLMVPEGKEFNTGDAGIQQPCNSYLKCKLFSTDEATRSSVIWGTAQPAFNFSQVAPVPLTARLLERMKNNVMIVEVWNKLTSPGGQQDRLLGLVKLSLHQFYMSFRDPKISHLLLQAQYPVVAVDSYIPVVDVFTGSKRGSLRVLLAMGSGDQVLALQRLRNDNDTGGFGPQRPSHFLDQLPYSSPRALYFTKEHASAPLLGFSIIIITVVTAEWKLGVSRVACVEARGSEEMDCRPGGTAGSRLQTCLIEPLRLERAALAVVGLDLKLFRTGTTLCVPDPMFNERQSHSLLAPSDIPVQRLLLSACSRQGLAEGGGIQFEVWCRYYYPNVRDQVVAKGMLPLSKLCAMVTMQHREEVGVQTFSLPLIPRVDGTEEHHPQPSGKGKTTCFLLTPLHSGLLAKPHYF